MPTMGELTPDAWDAEYRRTGRVVFPRRLQALYGREVLLGWALVILPTIGTINDLDTRGTWFYVRAGFVVILLVGAIHSTAQVLRGGPVLIVDTTGIHLGKNFTRWSAITTIGRPVSSFFRDRLPIQLTDEDGDEDELEIPRDNVDDLPALAAWLNHLHTEHHVA